MSLEKTPGAHGRAEGYLKETVRTFYAAIHVYTGLFDKPDIALANDPRALKGEKIKKYIEDYIPELLEGIDEMSKNTKISKK